MTPRRRAASAVGALLALVLTGGCGGDGDADGAADGGDTADGGAAAGAELEVDGGSADESLCRDQVDALQQPYGEAFPTQWTFPPDTSAYHVEEQGSTGTVVTAVSSAPFADILDFLNHDAQDAGFTITEGETEEHDAEANWSATDYRGRWTIRESAACPGETVIQVLAVPST